MRHCGKVSCNRKCNKRPSGCCSKLLTGGVTENLRHCIEVKLEKFLRQLSEQTGN